MTRPKGRTRGRARLLPLVACTGLLLLAGCGGEEGGVGDEPSAADAGARDGNSAGSVDSASISGYRLALRETPGSCRLTYRAGADAGSLPLAVPTPCRFHRGPGGDVRSLEARGGRLLLIESSRPHPERGGDCRTRVQGVRVRSETGDGTVETSSAVSRVTSCPPFQWDDHMFLGFWEEE